MKNQNKLANRAELLLKIKTFCVIELPIHILIMSCVFLVAFIFNKYIEAVTFLIAFFSLRYTYQITYHHEKPFVCIGITISMFTISISIMQPICFSLLSSILFAFFDTYLLFHLEFVKRLKEFHADNSGFKVETCSESQLINACKILKYNEKKIELAKKFFIDKISNEDAWNYLLNTQKRNIDLDTVRQYKYRMLKDLKKFEK